MWAVIAKLIPKLGPLVASILLWFGLSITSYKFGVAPFRTLIANEFGGAGFLVDWMGFFGVDQAITITLSAITAKYAVQGARAFLTKKG